MKTVAVNRPALFNYDVVERFEAGIALLGSEVKSVRDGRISLKEAFADVRNGEVFLVNCHISPYGPANRFNHDPLRPRKLLLHRREIKRLTGKIQERGFTLIPTKAWLDDKGRVKVEVALAKGRKAYEKREVLKERDREREARAALKHARR